LPWNWRQDIAKPVSAVFEIFMSPKAHLGCVTADRIQYESFQSEECRQKRREGVLTRYRIYRNSARETIYIATHESKARQDPQEFPNLNVALAVLREGGIPEYEIRRVTKELAAINGAIVQVAETLSFDHATEQSNCK
jgi:hypothetical protein